MPMDLSMTESELTTRANEKIDRIISEIDEAWLKQTFDDPVDAVLEKFNCSPDYPVDHQQFNQIIAVFVEKVYACALKKLWEGPSALTVAIELLEHYQGLYSTGYTSALMDVNDGGNGGIYLVLAGLAEAIKTVHCRAYVQSIFAFNISPNDWPLQHEIAGILLERYNPHLPPSLKNAAPAQIISQIPAIIQSYTAGANAFERIFDLYQEESTASRIT